MPYRGGTFPARFDIAPAETIERWRPFVQWFLAIPHLAVVRALQSVSQALAIISWLWIVFTGRLPRGVAEFQAMYMRYELRTASYAWFTRAEYPPFGFIAETADPGDDPRTRTHVVPDLGERNRLTVAFRIILVIPHLVVLALLGLAAVVSFVIAAFAVLFTERWPRGLRDVVIGVARWSLRVEAYLLLMTDAYPPFTLDDLPLSPGPPRPPPTA